MPNHEKREYRTPYHDRQSFYPINQAKMRSNNRAEEYPRKEHIIKHLEDFDFDNIGIDSIRALTRIFKQHQKVNNPPIPLGSYGVINYYFILETVNNGSLNSEHPDQTKNRSPLLRTLNITTNESSKEQDYSDSTRLVLVLGRLDATHHFPQRFTQSQWIIMLDDTKVLWAAYANSIENEDVVTSKSEKIPGHYEASWDTAFGADREEHKIVCLGHLSKVPFCYNEEFKKIQVLPLSWSTTIPSLDIQSNGGILAQSSKPILSPKTIEELLKINTSFLSIPYGPESKFDPKKDIYYLKNEVGYLRFCNKLDNANDFVVGSKLTEAAWCKALLSRFKKVDELEETREGIDFMSDIVCLSGALSQRNSEDVKKYWEDKAKHYSGLDKEVSDDIAVDCSSELSKWALDMLVENSKKVAMRKAPKSGAKPVGDMDVDDAELGETRMKELRAKAAKEGWIMES